MKLLFVIVANLCIFTVFADQRKSENIENDEEITFEPELMTTVLNSIDETTETTEVSTSSTTSTTNSPLKEIIIVQSRPNSTRERNELDNQLRDAAKKGNLTLVRNLIEKGANVSNTDPLRRSPLHFASLEGHADVVKILLDNGANVNIKNRFLRRSPLYIATAEGHLDVVKLLIANGADVNALDVVEWTPLHSASRNGYLEIVKILLENGAGVNTKDEFGRSPLDLALMRNKNTVAEELNRAGGEAFIEVNKFDDLFQKS